MDLVSEFERAQAEALVEGKEAAPLFGPGDTLRVHVKVVEGERERVQVFEGVCIARRGGGLGESFTVRKISYGEGVERVFPLHSPLVVKVERVRRGRVRRAKLHYLRGLRGRAARITERREAPGSEEVKGEAQGKVEAKVEAAEGEGKREKKKKGEAKGKGE